MTKIFIALASLVVLASASTEIASAQIIGGAAAAHGQAVNECRAFEKGDMNNHNAHLAIEACIQRVLHGDRAVY